MDASQVKTILLAEDDPLTRDLVMVGISNLGYQVITAKTGEEALVMARTRKPVLIILDTFLPGMGGLEVLRRLRATGTLKISTVVVISAFRFEETVHQFIEAGARDFFIKPLDLALFIERIKKLL